MNYPAGNDVSDALGGEYFDVLSFHYYPHLVNMPSSNKMNSDDYANGLIESKTKFEAELIRAGYPAGSKEFIVTETGVSVPCTSSMQYLDGCRLSDPAFPNLRFGGPHVARNYIIKASALSVVNKIRQLHWFTTLDGTRFTSNAETCTEFNVQPTHAFTTMGLFIGQETETPATLPMKDSTLAMVTVRDLGIGSKTYDAAASAALNPPANVSLFVFRGGANAAERITILWKSAAGRNDELAPAVLFSLTTPNVANIFVADYKNQRVAQTPSNGAIQVSLSGDVVFVIEPDYTPGAISTTVTATVGANPTTTVAGANPTTTVAGANPTTTVAGANPTTTVAGANPTTTVAGANPTTTVAGANPSTSTTPPTSCIIPSMPQPLVPCSLQCCSSVGGRKIVSMRMSTPFNSFNCSFWWNSFTRRSTSRLCRVWEGSTFIEMEVDPQTEADLSQNPAVAGVSDVVSFTDSSGRTTPVTTSGPDIGLMFVNLLFIFFFCLNHSLQYWYHPWSSFAARSDHHHCLMCTSSAQQKFIRSVLHSHDRKGFPFHPCRRWQ